MVAVLYQSYPEDTTMDDPNLEMMHLEEVSTIVVGGVGDEGMKKGPRIPLDHACKVCGAPASAYLHYGAIVCYSCRAFFRRAIRKHFVCRVGDYSCIMEGTRSNRCRGCRYQKCLQVGMKPEMVDAMLKRNPEGSKKRRKTESGMGKVNTQPIFSRSGRDGETSLADSLDVSAGSCQKFLVFNKSTQAFEPITIISINDTVSVTGDTTITSQIGTMPPSAVDAGFLVGDGVVGDSDSDVGLHMGQLQSSEDEEQENDQDEGMLIIRAMGSEAMEELNSLPESSDEGMLETKPMTTSMTASMTTSSSSTSQPPEWISNIVTDHEEVVQTCSDPLQLTPPTGSLMHHHTAGTLTASHTLPTELVVCSLSDTEVVQEEIIDTD